MKKASFPQTEFIVILAVVLTKFIELVFQTTLFRFYPAGMIFTLFVNSILLLVILALALSAVAWKLKKFSFYAVVIGVFVIREIVNALSFQSLQNPNIMLINFAASIAFALFGTFLTLKAVERFGGKANA